MNKKELTVAKLKKKISECILAMVSQVSVSSYISFIYLFIHYIKKNVHPLTSLFYRNFVHAFTFKRKNAHR